MRVNIPHIDVPQTTVLVVGPTILSVPLTFPLTVNEAVTGAPAPRMKAPCAFRQKLTMFPPAVVGGLLNVPQKLMVFPEKALVAVNTVFSSFNVSCAVTSSTTIFAVVPLRY